MTNKKACIIGWVFCAACLLSFTDDFKFDYPYFVQPKNFPPPQYNFSKNRQTETGFQLGRKLFYDPILSRDSSTSCSSCHLQATGFTHVDHSVSHGIEGRKGTRNSMALINLAWNTSFHWDGGVNNLEVQAINPITNPVEMDNSLENALKSLNKSAIYKTYFFKAFGDSVATSQNMLKALAQFTVSFVSYNSKYDKYVRHEMGGDMTEQELNGLKLFRINCNSCHKEPLFTDFSFQNNGLPIDTFYKDLGRYQITQNPVDSFKFKVPTLRNIEFTFPYMHDGRFKKLKDVINHYTSENTEGGIQKSITLAKELQKPIKLNANEKKDLIAFLLTLTDFEFLSDKKFGFPHE